MLQRRGVALIAAIALMVPIGVLEATTSGAAAVAALPPAADRMPGDVPTKKTPWVLDGEVTKIVQVGNTMIAGGLFTQVADPMNGTPYARQNLFAFDATTGLVSQTFNPTVDGQVQQLLPGPTPDTVYVAGDFTKINNKGPNHLQLLNVNTGQAVTSFKAPSTNGGIETMELLPNNRLFIGGFFTKIAGVNHGQLATLNATTGALDPFMDITCRGHHNTGTGAQGADRTSRVRRHPGRRPPGRDRQLPHRRRPGPRPDRDDRPDRRHRRGVDDLVHDAATRRSAPPARSTATCATSRCRPTAPSSSSPRPAARTAARSATRPRASRPTPSARR